MFKKAKPVIKIVKIKQETKDVTVKTEDTGYMMRGTSKRTEVAKDLTRVLLTVDGELQVREFNGHWDEKDLKVIEAK